MYALTRETFELRVDCTEFFQKKILFSAQTVENVRIKQKINNFNEIEHFLGRKNRKMAKKLGKFFNRFSFFFHVSLYH